MTMPTEFDDLLQNPALLRAALEFNDLAAPDFAALTPDAAEFRPLLAQLAENPRVRRFLYTQAPGKTSLWCFGPSPNRLALLPPPLLERLLRYWNAAVWAEDLARIIDKKRLLLIRARVGPEVCRYAARRGRFQLGALRARFRPKEEGEIPAIPADMDMEEWLMKTFPRPGEKMLALCIAHWPEALRAAWQTRWKIREQSAIIRASRRDAAAFPSFPAAWRWLEKIFTSEVAPEWQACFNSRISA
ncbi:MAG: SctK family type III secretion system sorting platform protein [Zoogloeaceae bacterium]|jgi:hypothetical protein|nr:SctK family type III secretion system sorting platform protein [Zoogloeaceae bacterium]